MKKKNKEKQEYISKKKRKKEKAVAYSWMAVDSRVMGMELLALRNRRTERLGSGSKLSVSRK